MLHQKYSIPTYKKFNTDKKTQNSTDAIKYLKRSAKRLRWIEIRNVNSKKIRREVSILVRWFAEARRFSTHGKRTECQYRGPKGSKLYKGPDQGRAS
jgi:hypothetical protein